jgi:hypothetical protein
MHDSASGPSKLPVPCSTRRRRVEPFIHVPRSLIAGNFARKICGRSLFSVSLFGWKGRFFAPACNCQSAARIGRQAPLAPKGAERVARACAPGPSQAGLAGASTALCSAQGGTFSCCPVPGLGKLQSECLAIPNGIISDPIERQPERPQLAVRQIREANRRHLREPYLPGRKDQPPRQPAARGRISTAARLSRMA